VHVLTNISFPPHARILSRSALFDLKSRCSTR
jgi:hypothetical protein